MAIVNLIQELVLLGDCEGAYRPNCPTKEPHVHFGVTWSANNWPVRSRAMVIRFLQMLRAGHLIKAEQLVIEAEEKVRRNQVECLQRLPEDYTESCRRDLRVILMGDDGKTDPAQLDSRLTRILMDSAVFFTD